METILTVNEDQIKNLGSKSAVELFRDLIWAESRKLGISPSKINISLRITVPDGGVDATVDSNSDLKAEGLIESGQNSYQIKAGENFKPHQKSAIQKELFDSKTPSKENLAQEVKSCLDKNGRYVLVCFGLDLIEAERNQAINHLKDFFTICGYINAKVDVWSINNLVRYIEDFPALTLRLNKTHSLPFLIHEEWSRNEDMSPYFEMGEKQKLIIDGIREQLQKNDAVHVRILGEAGVGKTRLVLEAINTDDLRSLVIYSSSANNFYESPLMMEITRNENMHAILIIDECDFDQRWLIWNRLKNHSPRIKLISIYNDMEIPSSGIPVYELPGLSHDHIRAIIQSYGVPAFEVDRWVRECDGSPRVAHIVGESLRSNPEDSFDSRTHINLWNRYICGRYHPDSENGRQRRAVLQHLALFKRFGYKMPLVNEAQAIHKLVQEADQLITWHRFNEIISDLQKQHILQGETTLYISPRLLHTVLWLEWWNAHGESFDLNRVANFPSKLIEWFFEMFEYAQGSPAASEKVKGFLNKDGIFQQNKGELLKTGFGARFFYRLTRAEPHAALLCLQKTIGKWSKAELLQLDETRSLIVSSLEYIVLWEKLFLEAARLLLALGEAENQSYSNNASGIFADLFSLNVNENLSKTEAPPSKRITILKESLDSTSAERRKLGLKACDSALSEGHWGMITDKYNIVGKKPNLWYPKTYGELFDAYLEVWQLLFSKLDDFTSEEQRTAVEVLLKNVRHLGTIPSLSEVILKDLKSLSEKEYVSKDFLVATVVEFVHNSNKDIPVEFKAHWEEFQKQLTGNEFHDLLVRYVAMNLHLVDDQYQDSQDAINASHKKIGELAEYGVLNQNELKAELDWLMSNDFYQVRAFAIELGKRDENRILLPAIVDVVKRSAQNRTAAAFLGSYLQASCLNDQNAWAQIIYSFSEDSMLVFAVPLVIWASGTLNDELANLLLNLVRKGKIPLRDFSLFSYGKFFEGISQDIVQDWLEFLLAQNDGTSTLIALSTHHQIYFGKKQVLHPPESLTLKLLTHPTLFIPIESNRHGHQWDWENIAEEFLEAYPLHALEISEIILEHFDEYQTFFDFNPRIASLLGRIAQKQPEKVWEQITKHLDPPYDKQAFSITKWLHGESQLLGGDDVTGALIIFHPNIVWAWVDQDVNQRAWYLATFVPRMLHHDEGQICWARELLVRYGQLDSVQRNLMANFVSGGWTGSAVEFYVRKKQKTLEFLQNETDQKVIEWLNEYLDTLERLIEREKIDEERDDF